MTHPGVNREESVGRVLTARLTNAGPQGIAVRDGRRQRLTVMATVMSALLTAPVGAQLSA